MEIALETALAQMREVDIHTYSRQGIPCGHQGSTDKRETAQKADV